MKRSIGKRVPCYWERDDIAIAEILVQLLDLIPLHDYSNSSLAWGAKRRRSQPKVQLQPQPPPSVGIQTKSNAVAAVATSPATPLMFSPSESDDNINKTNTPNSQVLVFKRKNKEDLMQSFTDLTHQKDSLIKEIEAARHRLHILRASNLELKHRKQINYGFSPSTHQTLHQQQKLLHYPFQLQQQSSTQWSMANEVTPVGIPDLNLTLDEVAAAGNVEGGCYHGMIVMEPNVNNSRALASAQARKRRMQIYKEKSQNQIIRQR